MWSQPSASMRRRGGGRVAEVAVEEQLRAADPQLAVDDLRLDCRGSSSPQVPARRRLRVGEVGATDTSGPASVMPSPEPTMQPSRRRRPRSSSGSSGAPPLPSSCSAERSNCSTTGWRAKAATSGGATSAWSTRWSCIAWSICSRSKRMSVTSGAAGVEPAVEHALQAHAVEEGRERRAAGRPPAPGTGPASARGSPPARGASARRAWAGRSCRWRAAAPRRHAVSGRSAGGSPGPPASSSPSSSTSTSPAAARAVSASGPTLTTNRGCARRSWSASSWAV